jgi:hypothetical protein
MLKSNAQNFEYSKSSQNFRVLSTRYLTIESLIKKEKKILNNYELTTEGAH